MNRAIEGLFTYMDEILVYSENEQKHMEILDQLFQRLKQYGLSVSLDKCQFGKSQVDYLGYQVSSSGIKPLSRKISAIQNIPEPKTQKELLAFLGGLNYFRTSLKGIVTNGKFQNTASILQPLYVAATTFLPSKQRFEDIWNHNIVNT